MTEDLLGRLADTLPLPVLRREVSRSSFWRDKVFRGFRPGLLTRVHLQAALQKVAVRRQAQVEKDIPDWWRSAYAGLLAELNRPDYRERIHRLSEMWSATVVVLALELTGHQADASLVPLKDVDGRPGAAPEQRPHYLSTVSDHKQALDLARLSALVKGLEKQVRQATVEKRQLETQLRGVSEQRRKLDRKVQELNHRLDEVEKALSAQRAANAREIIDTGTVVVYYSEIGSDARTRLLALAELRLLLATPAGEMASVSGRILELASSSCWTPFWQVDRRTGQLAVIRQPDDHILVGTVLLMEDLSDVQDLFA